MPTPKYICRCGNRTDKLVSYFIGSIRVTVCDECELDIKYRGDVIQVGYDEVKRDLSKQLIDTREK